MDVLLASYESLQRKAFARRLAELESDLQGLLGSAVDASKSQHFIEGLSHRQEGRADKPRGWSTVEMGPGWSNSESSRERLRDLGYAAVEFLCIPLEEDSSSR